MGKKDPTRVDIDAPHSILNPWQCMTALSRGTAGCCTQFTDQERPEGTLAAVTAMLDIMFEERGHTPSGVQGRCTRD